MATHYNKKVWWLAAEFSDGHRVILDGPRVLDDVQRIMTAFKPVDWFPGQDYKIVVLRDLKGNGKNVDVFEPKQVFQPKPGR